MLETTKGEAESLKVPGKCKSEFIVFCLDLAKPKAMFLDGTYLKAGNQSTLKNDEIPTLCIPGQFCFC